MGHLNSFASQGASLRTLASGKNFWLKYSTKDHENSNESRVCVLQGNHRPEGATTAKFVVSLNFNVINILVNPGGFTCSRKPETSSEFFQYFQVWGQTAKSQNLKIFWKLHELLKVDKL